jgi:hypothetical protein
MQAIPAIRIPRGDLPRDLPAIDLVSLDHMQWKGRRIEILGTTDDSRLVAELDEDDE